MAGYESNEAWWAALNADTTRGTALSELRGVVRRRLEQALGGRAGVTAHDLDVWCTRAVERVIHTPEEQPPASLVTWATALAVRAGLDELRRRAWQGAPLENVDLMADDVIQYLLGISAGAELEQVVTEGRAWDLLAEALHHELDDEERRLIALAYFSGASWGVVAQHLGMERDMLFKRLHTLRLRLREGLAGLGLATGPLQAMLEADLGPGCAAPGKGVTP